MLFRSNDTATTEIYTTVHTLSLHDALPIWVSTTDERGAVWALIVLGALLAVAALVSLAMPGVVATEWLTVLFGVLLFVAPWVLTYTDRTGASWTSWVVGVVAVVLGGSSVAFSGRGQQQAIQH